MIIVDANLLIYAVNGDDPSHAKAKTWLESVMRGTETVGFSWNVLLAFLRITTRPGILHKQLTVKQAFDLIDAWLASPVAVIANPGVRHRRTLRQLLVSRGTGGNLTSDAHLAALAIECEAELCTTGANFARFAGLRWFNPIK
jgi:toxin-antitoxin system PIN domain toxin